MTTDYDARPDPMPTVPSVPINGNLRHRPARSSHGPVSIPVIGQVVPPDGPAGTFAVAARRMRQPSEQYRTSSQTLAQDLRQTNGRPQVAQIFRGRSDFRRIFGMAVPGLAS